MFGGIRSQIVIVCGLWFQFNPGQQKLMKQLDQALEKECMFQANIHSMYHDEKVINVFIFFFRKKEEIYGFSIVIYIHYHYMSWEFQGTSHCLEKFSVVNGSNQLIAIQRTFKYFSATS